MRINRKAPLALALTVTSVAAIAAVFMASSGSAADSDRVSAIDAPAVTIGPAAEGPARMDVLKQATEPAFAALPKDVQTLLARKAAELNGGEIGALGSTMLGLDRLVAFAELGETLCVVQGSGDPGYSFACSPLGEFAAGGIYMALPGPAAGEPVEVIGFAPNGIAAVAVETESGAASRLPVDSNVWTTELPPADATFSGIGEAGNTSYSFDLPLGGLGKAQPGFGQAQ